MSEVLTEMQAMGERSEVAGMSERSERISQPRVGTHADAERSEVAA